jgi:rhomboid protease GluP
MSAEPAKYPPEGAVDLNLDAMMHGDLARTPATIALVAINLAAFAAMLMHGAGLWHSPNDIQLAWGAGFGPATKDGQWWRLGSALFLHFGLLHLSLNMWALWDGGRLVERLYGTLRFTALYFASGLAGNLASLLVQGDHAVSGGASGAVFGVYGALLACLWIERGRVHPVEFRWLFGAAAIFTVANVIFGLLIQGIDNGAHIGGLLSGMLAGVALVPAFAPDGTRRRAQALAAITYVLAVIALVVAIPPPSYRWQEELQAREEIRRFLDDDRRIAQRWQQILDNGKQGSASFDQLAGQIEADVTREYRESFEQLSSLHLAPAAPSTPALDVLKKYSRLQGEASQSLAAALRQKDPARIRDALEKSHRAPELARGAPNPPSLPATAPAR